LRVERERGIRDGENRGAEHWNQKAKLACHGSGPFSGRGVSAARDGRVLKRNDASLGEFRRKKSSASCDSRHRISAVSGCVRPGISSGEARRYWAPALIKVAVQVTSVGQQKILAAEFARDQADVRS
jgi:hypothetical protein